MAVMKLQRKPIRRMMRGRKRVRSSQPNKPFERPHEKWCRRSGVNANCWCRFDD